MNRDFVEMLFALSDAEVEFLVVGAHALAAHGVPRATGDLDIWVKPTPENAVRAHRALRDFGAPTASLTAEDLTTPEQVFQIGLPPCRIDILTSLTGIGFEEAWSRRTSVRVEDRPIPVLGRQDLIQNKRATGRPQDLADVARLAETGGANTN